MDASGKALSVTSAENLSSHLDSIVRKHMPGLQPFENQYKDLHEHPELGKQEFRTSKIVAKHMQGLGYDVHTGIGGYGVVGVLKNGAGAKVLLRADMDALPVEEKTGLPYSSKIRQRDASGEEVPVMHACGHDMHITCLLAAAKLLRDAKAEWNGTLICLFQPDEETGEGANAMVSDGLYDIVPVPDVILGQHVDNGRTGNVAITGGVFMAAADSFAVTIHGRGGHGSMPELTVDPILISAYTLVRLQSIVSRMTSPLDSAVVTCGSIHAGYAENIIPDEVKLKMNIRTYDKDHRVRVLHAVKQIIVSECRSAGAPQDPSIEPTTSLPLTHNDERLADSLEKTFTSFFGEHRSLAQVRLPGSEDFSNLAAGKDIPYALWFFGGIGAEEWDSAKRKGELHLIPRNHSSKYAPVIQPTMATGVQALSIAALHCFSQHSTNEHD